MNLLSAFHYLLTREPRQANVNVSHEPGAPRPLQAPSTSECNFRNEGKSAYINIKIFSKMFRRPTSLVDILS